jgi:ribosomal protein S18 acetylase RimI-like enzyme
MATITNIFPFSASAAEHLRPFDVRRDLKAVADLVEQCFADTLDPDGERYLQQMRAAASNPGFLRFAAAASEWSSIPMSGYVWVEDGRLVGNISLISYNMLGRRQFLIANVAVHPDYRQRGIARNLTLQAIEHVRQRKIPSVWLHVRENNEAAVRLYTSLGFVERARRTTWYSQAAAPASAPASGVRIVPRRLQDWSLQRLWLARLYPPDLTWHLPLNLKALQPGLLGFSYRMLAAVAVRQFSALLDGRLIGVLSWQAASGFSDPLWLVTDRDFETLAAESLLRHFRQHFSSRRTLSLDYPAHHAALAIQNAGFQEHQTLIWMSLGLETQGS